MARRIHWLNQALRELYHRCQFLEKTSLPKSLQLEEDVFQAVEILKDFPMIGRLVPDVTPEHRCLLVAERSHWVVYRVGAKSVSIVAVISTSQDFQKAWESRKRT
jgi:plasmid stabilization system protein ParE